MRLKILKYGLMISALILTIALAFVLADYTHNHILETFRTALVNIGK